MKKLLLTLAGLTLLQPGFAELPVEQIPNVEKLPADYPDSWLFALDANFHALIAGKVIIVDVAADSHEYKGAIGAAQFPAFAESSTKTELYVGETFYSRGTVGERTDVVTIYDKSSLEKTGEIVLPGGKRGLYVTNKFAMQLVDDDRYLLVYNFTPASSVTVIDVGNREILNEIPVPGCGMIYPTGQRGFSSLCGDGSMLSVQFDEQGQEKQRHVTEPFFSVDDDPLFDKPTFVDGMAYFVSYKAQVYPVDLSGSLPKPKKSWSLLSDEEQVANWRPGGWQVVTNDGEHLYVIMEPNGFDGSHKSGGGNIWVANIGKQTVVNRFQADTPAFSLEFVAGDDALLAVTNVNMWLDVYSPDGKLLRSMTLGDTAMPFAIYSKR